MNKLISKNVSHQTIGMLKVSYRMLVQDKKKYIGMIIGSTLSAYIMIMQIGVYEGIKYKITGFISQNPEPDLWVMDKRTPYFETGTLFKNSDLYNIRSINGVQWATIITRLRLNAIHSNTDKIDTFRIRAVESENLTLLPQKMIAGSRENIKQLNTVILDGNNISLVGVEKKQSEIKIGDLIEFQGKNIKVVGVTEPSLSLYTHSAAYMTLDTLKNITGSKNYPSFILVKAEQGINLSKLSNQIYEQTGYIAHTSNRFKDVSFKYFSKKTPILINFAILTLMGFTVGLLSIAELFYNLTRSNLNQFGMLKLMGVNNKLISKMIIYQGVIVGGFGYLLGTICIYISKWFILSSRISLFLYPSNFILVFFSMILLILFAAYLSIKTVLKHDTVDICQKSA